MQYDCLVFCQKCVMEKVILMTEGNELSNDINIDEKCKSWTFTFTKAVQVLQNVFLLSFPFSSHRVLRHTAVICTSRSLHIRATACRSNALEDEEGRGDNMLVFVDVENINTVSSYF